MTEINPILKAHVETVALATQKRRGDTPDLKGISPILLMIIAKLAEWGIKMLIDCYFKPEKARERLQKPGFFGKILLRKKFRDLCREHGKEFLDHEADVTESVKLVATSLSNEDMKEVYKTMKGS